MPAQDNVQEPSSPEFVRLLEGCFMQAIETLKAIASSRMEGRAGEVNGLLFALADTGRAVDILARTAAWNEMYMVARAFVERAVNICYLLACEEKEFRRFFSHARQKAYRQLTRRIRGQSASVELCLQGVPPPEAIPQMKEALAEFTSSRGREVTHWTSKDIISRIDIAAQALPVRSFVFLAAMLLIYADASEALHGTLYGCTFHLGIWEGQPPSDLAAVCKRNLCTVSCLFLTLTLMVQELARAFGAQGVDEMIVRKAKADADRAIEAYSSRSEPSCARKTGRGKWAAGVDKSAKDTGDDAAGSP